MDIELIEILKTSLPSHSTITETSSVITPIFSGTNRIYKIDSNTTPATVILRRFGSNGLISPEFERRNFELVSGSGQGPKSLYETSSYRIEEYLPGITLPREEVSESAEAIVPALYSYHQLSSGGDELCILKYINSWTCIACENFQKYYSMNNLSNEEKNIIAVISETIQSKEFKAKSFLPTTEEMIFSHNDFSYGNIIKGPDRYWIIDYEYSGPGHPSIDLATYIIESMFDFSGPCYRYHPEDEMPYSSQVNFVAAYADMARLDSDDLWNDVCRTKAAVNYLGMLYAACLFSPGNLDMLHYSINRLELFNKYSF